VRLFLAALAITGCAGASPWAGVEVSTPFGVGSDDDPRIAIRSELDVGSRVTIDGIDVGSPPLVVRVPSRAAPYHLAIDAAGYDGWRADVVLRPRTVLVVEIRARLAVEMREVAAADF
jgi:hypothetical protein